MADDKAVKKEKEPKPKVDKAKAADKAVKIEKAPKMAKKEIADKEAFSAKRAYDDKAKIKLLKKENPHREGSARAEAFESVKTCKTAGDYYATGNKGKYLSDWIESGHLEVA